MKKKLNESSISSKSPLTIDKEELETGINKAQLRTMIEYLWDGNMMAFSFLTRIRSFYSKKQDFTREYSVYLWLSRNKIKGQRLVDFFRNEGNDDQGNFLEGLNYICNRLDGRKVRREIIKIDEAY